MIFGRKKRQADTEPTSADAAEPVETAAAPVTDDAADTDDTGTAADTDTTADTDADDSDGAATTRGAQATEVAGTDEQGEDPEAEELDVEELDAQDWRTDGPWDASEVDPEQLEVGADLPRIDLGSVILTGVEGMELQLQVAEDTQQIVSAMMVLNEQVTVDDEVHELNSALEVAAFAAPRSPGFWSEIREEILEGAQEAGGSAGLTAGPFGVEVRRMMLLETPEGEQGYQPSRMWVVEGPRWILRGVVYGHGALEGVPGDHVEHIADVFRQIVVRRGDDPMAPGDLLPLRLPENMVEEPNEE
ncbi:hypothetical protein FHX74_003964 [Friedmanniella endophytica]|uniref:DUF3710 domain-containing protein n=1 Tax=Microlunatus kandeliicorticis TaxID=1759536 RepID=A0A7W3IW18_9ACTN|nr:DUF3710 domain-containing protein [Microlunatus kandeliicorticis]MBA8796311.1 hypothetical protein [Microlunatus kandeliicorticis]